MLTIKNRLPLIIFFTLLAAGVASAMNIFSSDFQKRWVELSKNVELLNEYTTTHPNIKLKGVNVEGLKLDGAIFNGGTFDGVDWKNVSAKGSKYLKVKFINCKFSNSRYWNAEFIDVMFEDCEFVSTQFLKSKFVNVKIVNCKGIEAEFDELKGSELIVENTVLNDRSSFTGSEIPLVFRNTTLSGVNMMGLSGNHPLTIEGGILDEVDFYKSHFSTVILRRVWQGEGPVRFNGTTAESIRIEDVDMWRGLSLAEIHADYISIKGGKLKTSFSDSVIAKVYAHDVEFYLFSLSEANLPQVTLTNCIIHSFPMWDGYTDELIVQNSSIGEIDGENFKADLVLWDNVTLDGKIDLTNAQVKDFRPTRLKRGSKLNLITTGSNMRF
ncbi:MAG: pentapeptide repeat-containing protein [Desulforhopalus sp.]